MVGRLCIHGEEQQYFVLTSVSFFDGRNVVAIKTVCIEEGIQTLSLLRTEALGATAKCLCVEEITALINSTKITEKRKWPN